MEKHLNQSTRIGKDKYGYVPSPSPVGSNSGKGLVPTPAPNTRTTSVPSQTVKK